MTKLVTLPALVVLVALVLAAPLVIVKETAFPWNLLVPLTIVAWIAWLAHAARS